MVAAYAGEHALIKPGRRGAIAQVPDFELAGGPAGLAPRRPASPGMLPKADFLAAIACGLAVLR